MVSINITYEKIKSKEMEKKMKFLWPVGAATWRKKMVLHCIFISINPNFRNFLITH